MKFCWLYLLLFVSSAFVSSVFASSETEYLKRNALPINSLALESDSSDLEPLGNLVGDARIVAMGEGTHGTAEFTRVRARMLEVLVKRKGFTVFALEASWAGSRALNAYVNGGAGDGKALLQRYARLMWPWRTQEMLETLEWMRTYNARPDTRVKLRFTGFDLQDPVSAVDWIVEYLETHASDGASRADDLLGCIRFSLNNALAVGRYTTRGMAGVRQCEANIQTVRRILENRRVTLEKASGTLEFTEILQATRVLEQENAYYAARFVNPFVDAIALRDEYMARNIAWLEATYKQKLVVWAHNGHVTFTPDMAFGWKPTGAYLRERYGSRYFVIATTFHTGSFNAQLVSADLARTLTAAVLGLAQNPSEQRVPPPEPNSLEQLFYSSGNRQFLLPLRVPRTLETAWLWKPRRFYIVPQNLPPFDTPTRDWYSYDATLPLEFDAVVYVQDSTPTKLL
jgi:erythromycin esterase